MQDVAGKGIVIFRGEGGRELIADTLAQRGAHVEHAEVYRRTQPTADVGELLRHWARGEIQVAVVTSNEGLRNLFDMVGKLGQRWLRSTQLVVVSERAAALARELGFERPARVASEASDAGILAALRDCVPG
jgi:uroporphyrinogen-III synthase